MQVCNGLCKPAGEPVTLTGFKGEITIRTLPIEEITAGR